MVAALLGEEPSRLRGVPEISDVAIVSGLLELHGVDVGCEPERHRLDHGHGASMDRLPT